MIRIRVAAKGHYYLCIKTVVMETDDRIQYVRGIIYYSAYNGCITNEDGDENHMWSDYDDDRITDTCLSNNFVDLGTEITPEQRLYERKFDPRY